MPVKNEYEIAINPSKNIRIINKLDYCVSLNLGFVMWPYDPVRS